MCSSDRLATATRRKEDICSSQQPLIIAKKDISALCLGTCRMLTPTRMFLIGVVALSTTAAAHEVVVGLPLQNEASLETLFWQIADPHHPEYLRHRSLPELAELVGASESIVSAARRWLVSEGATGVRLSALRDVLTAEFPEGQPTPRAADAPLALDFLYRREPRFGHALVPGGTCAADLAATGVAVGKAAGDIAKAVGDCKGSPTGCASDISAAVGALGEASQQITAAVKDCGGSNNTACAKDVTAIAASIGNVGSGVAKAVDDCKSSGLKCVLDVGGAAVQLGKITEDIVHATKDCAGEQRRSRHGTLLRSGFGGPSVAAQKKAWGIPVDLAASNSSTLQMVWGPGTFGYSKAQLYLHKVSQCPLLNMSRIKFDTPNHGETGGDNYGEGNLDVQMITSFGLNVETIVSNTNTSASTEEGSGFGLALLDFLTELASRSELPQVLSISLGSESAASCDLLCEGIKARFSLEECNSYLQRQRQVCMFLDQPQVARINTAFKLLGARGVTVFGSSGDGGSHFSFQEFEGGAIADALNEVACKLQLPVFPTASPYIVSVGGTQWPMGEPDKPEAWPGSGGGLSWQFPAPAHQAQSVAAYLRKTSSLPGMAPPSSFNASGRAYPDVAAMSTDGTSQSSPTVAGIWSLLMDHRLNNGLPPLGFVAPRIWQVAEQFPGEAFTDVTKGDTKTSCDNGFPATEGWDAVTGWGRPNWSGMVKHFGTDDGLH